MGGFDDHVAIAGDWLPPSPSPRTFFSSMMDDDNAVVQSIPNSIHEDKSASHGDADQNNPTEPNVGDYEALNENALTEPKIGSRGGLMDRIAARAGFNAPRLNTESIRPTDLCKSSGVRSPYLTIPPGLSPTTLLDSPVFVNNSLVQPSPTTGKFSFAPSGINQSSEVVRNASDKGRENAFEDMSSFAFKPNLEPGSVSFPHFNTSHKAVQAPSFALASFPGVKSSVHSNTSLVEPPNFQKSHGENRGSNLSLEQSNSVAIADNSSPMDELHEDSGDPNLGGSQAEDGYNWRKYGQKQVKGSEFPRSYYKCTHPNCPVKKKVERSLEGHITEIIYKGTHNHPKPPPNRRSSLGSSNDVQPDPELNGDPAWSAMQIGNNFSRSGNWSQENVEASSSVQEYNNRATFLAQNGSGDGVDGSCTFSNDEDDDDRATHGSVSLGYNEGEGDELESKRRRIEAYSNEMSSAAARAIREPRVVVQTTSEVDILDDGYRWRKYGQKVVKGNPNPRSYYKCTSPGCNVRKHVERASHDLKSVITTYEGKHNHDVPAARNSSHVNNTSAPPVSSNVHRPEPSHLHRTVQHPSFVPRPQMPPGPGFGFGINHPGLAMQAAMARNQGNFSVMPNHPYFGQARPLNDVGFMVPKSEPKMEPATDGGAGSYQQVVGRIGPQLQKGFGL